MAIIDFHVHPLPVISSRDILAEMASVQVEKAVLLSMDLDPTILTSKKLRKDITRHFEYTAYYDIEPIFSGMNYVLNNGHTPMSHVAKLVKAHKNKFIGFGSIHIGYKSKRYVKTKLKELKFYKEEYGFKGIKILPTLQFFSPSDSNLNKVFRFAEKEEMIILYHTGCDPGPWELPLLSVNGNPKLLEPLLKKFNVQVVLAHIGSYSLMYPNIWFKEAIKVIKENNNVYGDLSAVPYIVTQKETVEIIKQANVFSKILYGSDYPVTSAGANLGMSTAFSIVNNSELLSPEEKELIFYQNSAQLLKL